MVLSIARGVGGVKPGTFLVSKMEKNKQIDSIYIYLSLFTTISLYFSKMLLLEWLLSFFKDLKRTAAKDATASCHLDMVRAPC